MGVGTLLRRRLLTHPVALVAVATSVLMSMVVVATLQLLSSAIADASVSTTLDVPGEQRSVALTTGVRPGELADVATWLLVGGGAVAVTGAVLVFTAPQAQFTVGTTGTTMVLSGRF